MTEEPSKGGLFRRNYLRETIKLSDSDRARKRFSVAFRDTVLSSKQINFAEDVERCLGIEYPSGYNGYIHSEFWEEAQLATC